MGLLKDIFQIIWKDLVDGQDSNMIVSKPRSDKEIREVAREQMIDELKRMERLLLMTPQQRDTLMLYEEKDAKDAFDELEFITKNNIKIKQHREYVKESILDLDEISTTENLEETKELHCDELSTNVLNMLHRQSAQFMLLKDDENDDQEKWFVKDPKSFIEATLLEANRKGDAFRDVSFENNLSAIDLDCNKYLRKTTSQNNDWIAIRKEDENFNKDAILLLKNIQQLSKKAASSAGNEKAEYERQKARAEKVLRKATDARCSALEQAFRNDKITDYYYRQRTQQLLARDYSKTPDFFEIDAIKNRNNYLKAHDLQDLKKEEADMLIANVTKKAEQDKKLFLIKDYLVKNSLASSKRYLLSEMDIDHDVFFLGMAEKGSRTIFYNVVTGNDKVVRVAVDLEDTQPTNETKKQEQKVPQIDPLEKNPLKRSIS